MEPISFLLVDERVFIGLITKFIKFIELNFSVITRSLKIKVCMFQGLVGFVLKLNREMTCLSVNKLVRSTPDGCFEWNPTEQSRLGIFLSKEIFEGGMIRIHNAFVHDEDCTDSKVACIAHELKGQISVRGNRDWSFSQFSFECFKSFNTLFGEKEWGIFFKETSHRSSYLQKVFYEPSIEAGMTKKATDTLNSGGMRTIIRAVFSSTLISESFQAMAHLCDFITVIRAVFSSTLKSFVIMTGNLSSPSKNAYSRWGGKSLSSTSGGSSIEDLSDDGSSFRKASNRSMSPSESI
nr:hypothetical protein [Tanacetum cinerariifolium]